MTLILHCGADPVDYDGLRGLHTPEATESHVPIPHSRIVDLVRHTLTFHGHVIQSEEHGTTQDGARYFGVMQLASTYGGYEDSVILRNSHDKSFPVGVGFGSHVFCCDNMAFIADTVIKRRHTVKLKRDLPGMVIEIVEPLAEVRRKQHESFDRFKAIEVTDTDADHLIMEMYRQKVINVTKIADVHNEWQSPTFEEMAEQKNAWRLFNAATFALRDRAVQHPAATQALHTIIEGMCEAA